MAYENKPNTGALFKNDKKSDNAPDYKGPFYDANGEEMEIAAWLKTSGKGTKYMSVKVSPPFKKKADDEYREAAQPATRAAEWEDPDSEMPF